MKSRFSLRLLALLLCALCTLTACEKDAQTLANEGNLAMTQQKHDEAINLFNQSLQKDAKNYNALVGIAQVYAKKNEFAKANEFLDKARNVGPPNSKAYITQRAQEFLIAEIKHQKDLPPKEYEEKLRKVIELKKNSGFAAEAYTLLGDHYVEQAEKLSKDPKTREESIIYHEKMLTIRTTSQRRKLSLKRAADLRVSVFNTLFQTELDALKPKLGDRYDASKNTIKFTAAFEEKGLSLKGDDEKKVMREKLVKKIQAEALQIAYILLGREKIPDQVPVALFKDPETNIGLKLDPEAEVMEKGKASITASIDLVKLKEILKKEVFLPAHRAKTKAIALGKTPEDAAGSKKEKDPQGKPDAKGADPTKKSVPTPDSDAPKKADEKPSTPDAKDASKQDTKPTDAPK